MCAAVPATPSDGDAGRPDEDTFGVSFLLSDDTGAEDIALRLWELGASVFPTQIQNISSFSKDPCGGLCCVLTCSAGETQQNVNLDAIKLLLTDHTLYGIIYTLYVMFCNVVV